MPNKALVGALTPQFSGVGTPATCSAQFIVLDANSVPVVTDSQGNVVYNGLTVCQVPLFNNDSATSISNRMRAAIRDLFQASAMTVSFIGGGLLGL